MNLFIFLYLKVIFYILVSIVFLLSGKELNKIVVFYLVFKSLVIFFWEIYVLAFYNF